MASGPTQVNDWKTVEPNDWQTVAAPHWSDSLNLSNPVARGAVDFAEGAASGIANTVFQGGDLIRRATGMQRVINNPDVQQAVTPPDSLAGKAGRFVEQGAEFIAPMGMVGKAVKAAPLAGRLGAEALAAGGTAAVQSGGDPRAIAGAALTQGALGGVGAAIPAVGRAAVQRVINMAPRPLSEGAVNLASEVGVPLSRGTQGGSRFVQGAEKVLGHTVAPDLYEGMVEAGQAGITKAVNKAAGNFATDHFAAGDSTLKKLISHSSSHENEARSAYSKLAALEADPANIVSVQTGQKTATSSVLDASGKPISTVTPITEQIGLPVDTRPQKAALQPIYDRILKTLPFAQQQYSRGLKALQNILEGPDVVPASIAEENLSALKAIQREAVDDKVKVLASKAINEASPAVESAVAKAGPDALKALRAARSSWKEHEKTLEIIDQLSGDVTGRTGQTEAAKRLLRPADASFPQLQKVLEIAPEAADDLGRAYLARVFQKAGADSGGFTNPTQAANLFNQIGKRTKEALYSPEQIDSIKSTLELAKRLSENPNPSNSGMINAMVKMGLMVTHPVGGVSAIAFGRKMAKVLYEPEGAAALREVFSNPASPNTSKALAIIKGIADKSGESAGQGQ